MGKKLRKIAPGVNAIPKINQSLFKINRDVRFSAEYLLYNGLTARVEEKVPDAFYSDAIIDYAYAHYKNMLPLHRWLKKVLDE